MRYFPGALLLCATRRRLVALLATLLVGVGAVVVPLASAENLHHRQDRVQDAVRHAQRDLDESSKATRRATARLEATQHELAAAKRHLDAVRTRLEAARKEDARMAARLATARQRLADARTALAEGQDRLEVQRTMVRNTVSSLYEQGDPQLIAFSNLMRSGSTEDLTRRDALNGTIVDKESQVYTDLDDAEQQLAARETEVQQATAEVADQRAAAARNLALMKRLTEQAKDAKHSYQERVAAKRVARQHALRVSRRDRAKLARLHDREDRIRRQILAAQRRARGTISVRAGGFLLPPVTGPITSPYGYRIHPIYGYWGLHDGTDFGVACGEGMRAAGDGVVTERYWSDVYGNRLYVSLGSVNGKNLTVVYNHASGYRVGVGQHVSRGEIVGYVGSTGWSTGCHLHFEVLVNGVAVDPENWL